MEESHLARVIDPAGGSWYVERLTDELAAAAWAFFQETERAGGLPAALRSGMVAEKLAATWAARSAKLARRKEPVTGSASSRCPPSGRWSAIPPRSVRGRPGRSAPGPARRGVRGAAGPLDAHLVATGARPKVFIAALGPAAAHTARVSFAVNLFGAGGIEAVHEPVSVDAETAAGAFTASGAGVACLCSSDALYAEQAAGVAGR